MYRENIHQNANCVIPEYVNSEWWLVLSFVHFSPFFPTLHIEQKLLYWLDVTDSTGETIKNDVFKDLMSWENEHHKMLNEKNWISLSIYIYTDGYR